MITDSIRMTGLMDELAEVLDGDIDLYMIGGGAMMFLGSKASTKDIDLVVSGADAYRSIARWRSSASNRYAQVQAIRA